MRCPGQIEAGCSECQNYFFSECLAGDHLRFIPRMSGGELQIFAIQLRAHVTKEAIVNVYASNPEEARLAVEADLEKSNGRMGNEVADGEEMEDGYYDVDVYTTSSDIVKTGEYVAFDNKIYSVSDFKDMIESIKSEGDGLPIIAESASA